MAGIVRQVYVVHEWRPQWHPWLALSHRFMSCMSEDCSDINGWHCHRFMSCMSEDSSNIHWAGCQGFPSYTTIHTDTRQHLHMTETDSIRNRKLSAAKVRLHELHVGYELEVGLYRSNCSQMIQIWLMVATWRSCVVTVADDWQAEQYAASSFSVECSHPLACTSKTCPLSSMSS